MRCGFRSAFALRGMVKYVNRNDHFPSEEPCGDCFLRLASRLPGKGLQVEGEHGDFGSLPMRVLTTSQFHHMRTPRRLD